MNAKQKELNEIYDHALSESEIDQFKAEDKGRSKEDQYLKYFFNDDHSENLIQSDLNNTYITVLRLTDLIPGTMFRLVFDGSGDYYHEYYKLDEHYQDIAIGATGNYYADELRPIYGVYLIKSKNNPSDLPISLSGAINYQYITPTRTEFSSIVSTAASVGEYSQFVGEIDNLVTSLESKHNEITTICMSRYFKRPVEYLIYDQIITFPEDAYKAGYAEDDSGELSDYRELVDAYRDKLYWELYNGNSTNYFSEKSNLEYSPFSIYVLLKKRSITNIKDGKYNPQGLAEKQALEQQIKDFLGTDEIPDKYNTHIEHYFLAQTAEQMLIEKMAFIHEATEGYKNAADEQEKDVYDLIRKYDPIYVFDPWSGKVLPIGEPVNEEEKGKCYYYNPAISYNGEWIDLKEIQRYDLDNLEPAETTIEVGNGVYGDIFYHNIETFYSFEDVEGDLKDARDAYNTKLIELRDMKWPNWPELNNLDAKAKDPSRKDLDDLDKLYTDYCELLETAINNWKTRETDLKE